jgi:hypothetical protein
MMEIIHGPTAPVTAGGIIYQVTLASGMIVTSPAAFGAIESNKVEQKTIVTEDGRVLITPLKATEPKPTTP